VQFYGAMPFFLFSISKMVEGPPPPFFYKNNPDGKALPILLLVSFCCESGRYFFFCRWFRFLIVSGDITLASNESKAGGRRSRIGLCPFWAVLLGQARYPVLLGFDRMCFEHLFGARFVLTLPNSMPPGAALETGMREKMASTRLALW